MSSNNEQHYHQQWDASPSLNTPHFPALEQQYPGVANLHNHQGLLTPVQPQMQPQTQPQMYPPMPYPMPYPPMLYPPMPQPQNQTQTLVCVLPDGRDLASTLDLFSQFGNLSGFRFERLERGTRLFVQYQKEAALNQAIAQCQPNVIIASVNLMPLLGDPTVIVRVNKPTIPESAILKHLHIDQSSVIRTSSTESTGYLLRFHSKNAKADALYYRGVFINKVRADITSESEYVKVCPKAPLELDAVRKFFEENYGVLDDIISDRTLTFTFATREKANEVVELGKQISDIATVSYSTYKNTAAKQQPPTPSPNPPKPHPPKKRKIANYVRNIPPNTTDANLKAAFAKFKPIYARVLKDKNGILYGIVDFKSEEDRAAAEVGMNKKFMNGQMIKVRQFYDHDQ